MKISKIGEDLLAKYKKLQKVDVLLLLLAAVCGVFFGQWILTVLLAAVTFVVVEGKLIVCPHCKKPLDPRKKIKEETVCPRCEKYVFMDLK